MMNSSVETRGSKLGKGVRRHAVGAACPSVAEETHEGIEANVASVLAVEVDRTLEEGNGVREVTLHLERAHSGCHDKSATR